MIKPLKPPKPKLPSEAQIHTAVEEYLSRALTPNVRWTTFPAGGGGRVRGAKLKASGLRAGWPDLQFVHPKTGVLHTIELKASNGYMSDEQGDVINALCVSYAPSAGARSVVAVDRLLREWGFPMKTRAL